MDADRKHLLAALLAVGSAAVLGVLGTRSRDRRGRPRGPTMANVAARVVTEPPPGATVVAPTNPALARVPAARTVIQRAVDGDVRDRWEHLTVESDGAWHAVDVLHGDLPYFDGGTDAHPDGVYVAWDGTVVVLDAIGWVQPDAAGA